MQSSIKKRFGLFLSFDNNEFYDGIGAQLLRKFFVHRFAVHYNFGYIDAKILKFQIHPTDMIEDEKHYESILNKINTIFVIENIATNTRLRRTIRVSTLPTFIRKLIFRYQVPIFALLNALLIFTRQAMLIQTNAFSEKTQRRIINSRNVPPSSFYMLMKTKEHSPSHQVMTITVHIRRGDLTLYSSENTEIHRRVIPTNVYAEILRLMTSALSDLRIGYKIYIVTDASPKTFIFTPLRSQIEYWSDFPSATKEGSIEVKNDSLDNLLQIDPNIEICYGEGILESFNRILESDVVMISRSSFSYLASLIRRDNATLYFPFWHPCPLQWKDISGLSRTDFQTFFSSVALHKGESRPH